MAQQLARARDLLSGDENVPPTRRGQLNFHLVSAVAAQRMDLHIGELRAPANQIPILPRAVGAPGAGQIHRLQHVRLALSIVAQQHRHALAGLKRAFLIISKILQLQLSDTQSR